MGGHSAQPRAGSRAARPARGQPGRLGRISRTSSRARARGNAHLHDGASVIKCLTRVVLPAPKKPETTSAGTPRTGAVGSLGEDIGADSVVILKNTSLISKKTMIIED